MGLPPDRPLARERIPATNLRQAWEDYAAQFIAWARKPNHDSYWRHHRDEFLPLVPKPGRRTLDLGCGEGRLSRDLTALGHRVIGLDASRTMLAAARAVNAANAATSDTPAGAAARSASALAASTVRLLRANAAALPFASASFDCVVAFMSLQDIDDLTNTLRETHRVLEPGGRLCLAIVHPLNSAGSFDGHHGDSRFIVDGSYLDESYYADHLFRDGLPMTFVSVHRPLATYTEALAEAGFLIERVREPALPERIITSPHQHRWRRIPLFLHVRAVKLKPTD
jgi:SAM-dependent methyltransferase